MKKIIALSLLLAFAIPAAWGMYPKVRNFSKREYRAGTQNWDITQVKDGCMYFGNNAGLLEFDGASWARYSLPNFTTVRSILYDETDRRMYAGGSREFGYFSISETGEFVYESLSAEIADSFDIGEVWDIHKVDNSLFFCGDRKIVKILPAKTQSFDFAHKIDCTATAGSSFIISSVETGPMILAGEFFVSLSGAEMLKGKKVCAILLHSDKRLFFVTEQSGIYVYDDGTVSRYVSALDPLLERDRLFSAAIDGNVIALGTVSNGVLIHNLDTGGVLTLDKKSRLQNNTVLSVFFDSDSNLWLGLDNGLDLVMLNNPEYLLLKEDGEFGAGYCSLISGGKVYIGTNQGLYWGCDNSAVGSYRSMDFTPVRKLHGQVWCLKEIDGTVFCGHDSGLYEINSTEARKIEGVDGIWNLIRLNRPEPLILGCSYSGLFLLRKTGGSWNFAGWVDGFREVSGMFEEDSDGRIWFSHWITGLYRLTLSEDCDSVVDIDYFGINRGLPSDWNNAPFRFNGDFVFSSDGGYYYLDRTSDTMLPHAGLNSLFGSSQVGMCRLKEDPAGNLFFTAPDFFGVAFNDGDGNYRLDSLSLKFLSTEIINGFEHMLFPREDIVLLSTENGFSVIDLKDLRNEPSSTGYRRNVFIKEISLSGSEHPLYSSRRAVDRIDPLTLSYKQNSIAIEYALPEYRSGTAIMYSCFMENYDSVWSDFSQANSKEYSRLRNGHYKFMVRSQNYFTGEISETGFDLEITPPWYKTTMARVIYILLGCLFVWLVTRILTIVADKRVSKVKREKEREIRVQRERFEKEAREKEKELIILQNQGLEYDLKLKSNELANSTLNLVRKNEILLKIETEINKVIPGLSTQDNPKAVSHLKKIRSEIRDNIEHDVDWTTFEHNFDMVYQDYLKRLKDNYPKLSINDLKLCAYIRMDLHTKDIAPLMNMSYRSVEMTRHRLRTKLGLSRDVNLAVFLQNF